MAGAPAPSTPEAALTPVPLHPSHPRCHTERRTLGTATQRLSPTQTVLKPAGTHASARISNAMALAEVWLWALSPQSPAAAAGCHHSPPWHPVIGDTAPAAVSTRCWPVPAGAWLPWPAAAHPRTDDEEQSPKGLILGDTSCAGSCPAPAQPPRPQHSH